MLSNPKTLPVIAIFIEIIITGIISPIISDIRENHKTLKREFTQQISEAQADLEAIRKEIYRDFVTGGDHRNDIDGLFNQVNRLEARLYELNNAKP